MHASAERVVELVDGAVKGMSKNPVPSGELQSTLIARRRRTFICRKICTITGMMKSGYLAAGGWCPATQLSGRLNEGNAAGYSKSG